MGTAFDSSTSLPTSLDSQLKEGRYEEISDVSAMSTSRSFVSLSASLSALKNDYNRLSASSLVEKQCVDPAYLTRRLVERLNGSRALSVWTNVWTQAVAVRMEYEESEYENRSAAMVDAYLANRMQYLKSKCFVLLRRNVCQSRYRDSTATTGKASLQSTNRSIATTLAVPLIASMLDREKRIKQLRDQREVEARQRSMLLVEDQEMCLRRKDELATIEKKNTVKARRHYARSLTRRVVGALKNFQDLQRRAFSLFRAVYVQRAVIHAMRSEHQNVKVQVNTFSLRKGFAEFARITNEDSTANRVTVEAVRTRCAMRDFANACSDSRKRRESRSECLLGRMALWSWFGQLPSLRHQNLLHSLRDLLAGRYGTLMTGKGQIPGSNGDLRGAIKNLVSYHEKEMRIMTPDFI